MSTKPFQFSEAARIYVKNLDVVREMREETGLNVHVGEIVEVLDRIGHDADGRVRYHYVLVDFVCRVESGTLACASDAVDAIWAPIPDLDRYGLSETAVTVVHRGVALSSGSRRSGGVLGEPQ